MSLYNEWSNTTPASTAKKNLTSVIGGTGAYLSALDKTKFQILVCKSTGSGLTVDHVYLCNAAGDALIDLTAVAAHTHSSSTDGGDIFDVFRTNSKYIDTGHFPYFTQTEKYYYAQTVTSTASITDDSTGNDFSVKLATGATSGSGATIEAYGGAKLDLSKRSQFQCRLKIGTASSLALHVGINADNITAADSNTAKYNAEICTTTNSNWFLRSANGSANSTSDLGTAMSTSMVGVKLEHFPDLGTPKVDMYLDTASAFTKTTHVPTTGNTTTGSLFKSSLKNNTAADRTLFNYAFRVRYTTNDVWY